MLAKLIITPVLYEVLEGDQLIPIPCDIPQFSLSIVADSQESLKEKIDQIRKIINGSQTV